MQRDNPSKAPRIVLTIFAAVLQAVLLYAALLTYTGRLPIPAEFSIMFLIFGVACLVGAFVAGSGIKSKTSNTQKSKVELILPSLGDQPTPPPSTQEHTAFGHTEYVFDSSSPDQTEFLATEMAQLRRLKLTWSEGGGEKSKEILNFPVYIGRDASSCAVVVNDPSVSRRHTQISLNSGVLSVSDAGSSNGTLLDGSPVTSDMEIHSGQVLKLGRVSIQIEIQD